jgi:hypothetical protein
METDLEWLRSTNIEIGNAETQGNKEFFETLLAPCLAFRRANGQILDRPNFIAGVSPSAKRTTNIQSITVLEKNRALIECTVTMEDDGGAKRFHNVRLFVREGESNQWMLLGWANEPII